LNGLDEAAAVFGLFEAVSSTGVFSLTPDAEDCGELTLKYDREGKERSMKRDELTRFVQHVSLIQHEDEAIAAQVSCFNEQYHTVAKVAQNILRLKKLGFDADIESLNCSVSQKHIGHSRTLLLKSEADVRESDAKIRHLTELYPCSLLFYPHELRQIYEHLSAGLPAMRMSGKRWHE